MPENCNPSQDQDTRTLYGDGLKALAEAHELAIGAVLRADRVLASLSTLAADPSTESQAALARAVAQALPAVHMVLRELDLVPVSADAFKRYVVTPDGARALGELVEQHDALARRLAERV